MRTTIQTLFDEFKLHTHDDYVYRGFSGRIRQLIIQGVDTPTKAAWVAEFIQELTARMRKCEYTVTLRPEPWFPQVPSHIRYGIYVVVNQGVLPVDDLDQSGVAEWHAFEDRQFATATAFLALSSDRPAESPTEIPTGQSPAAESPAPLRTSVGKLLCWDGRSVTCFVESTNMIRGISTAYLTRAVDFAWVHDGKFIPLATVAPCKPITYLDNPFTKLNNPKNVVMCVAGTLEPALCAQLPVYKFDLYKHTVEQGDELVNSTDDDVVVCKDSVRQMGPGCVLTAYYHMVTPGNTVRSATRSKKVVVCSEPVLQLVSKVNK